MISLKFCRKTGLTYDHNLCTLLGMTRFIDTISEKSRRKWIEEGHQVKQDPTSPGVEYDPFIDLEDIDEIAALMQQPPGNGREDDE